MTLLRPIGSDTCSASCLSPMFSLRSSAASSARRTASSSFAVDRGFSRKSYAPSRVASTAVSTVPWPDIMMTGASPVLLSDHSLNREIPSESGIQMSSRTRSGRRLRRDARAFSAFSAVSTS